jgi:glutamate N-acetyltransferase/amino-acid N-acetyltransferase
VQAFEVFLASTGVIGEPLDATKFASVLETMAGSASGDRWLDAARAIMTTDTYPKVATRTATVDGVTVRLNGMAKGAGMIAPDMATMLSFVLTDADIEPAGCRRCLAAMSAQPSMRLRSTATPRHPTL